MTRGDGELVTLEWGVHFEAGVTSLLFSLLLPLPLPLRLPLPLPVPVPVPLWPGPLFEVMLLLLSSSIAVSLIGDKKERGSVGIDTGL